MTTDAGVYLRAYLEPFAPFLERSDVTDLYVNRVGELWIETLGGGIERHNVSALDEKALLRLARQIASYSHQGINRSQPLLSARLPGGERMQIVLPPAAREGPALAIRKFARSGLDIASYAPAESHVASDGLAARRSLRQGLAQTLKVSGTTACLQQAVAVRANILISGGTSTGKTTFLNALLAEIPEAERLISIEDTAELAIRQPNSVGLLAVRGRLGESDVTANDLVTASLRLRPDRIIIGELRGDEAFAFLRAVNSGHPGSMTTVHADSPGSAVTQLALLCQSAQTTITSDMVRSLTAETIDVFVQLQRVGAVRGIQQVLVSG